MNKAERKIKTALDEAAQHHRKGMDPDQAIAKAASSNHLNPDMVERVVEAFNIAKTNSTLSKAPDKTASFPLADRTKVMGLVFRSTPLSKSASILEETIDPQSILEEVHQEATPFSWTNHVKVASAPEDLSEAVVQMRGAIQMLDADLSKKAQDVQLHQNRAFDSLKEVISFFESSSNLGKFAQFERDILSEYGDGAKTTLEIVYDLAKLAHFREPRFTETVKLASYQVQRTPVHDTFDRLMEQTAQYHAADAVYDATLEDVTSKRAEYNDLLRASAALEVSLTEKSAADILFGDGVKKKSAELKLELPSTGLISSAQQGVSGGIAQNYGAAHTKAVEQHFKGPGERADAEMNNVKRQRILQELMAHDDIVAKMDPQHVEHHYNTLLQIAPDLTLNPSIVASFLHSANANQAVDPYTATQLAQLQGQHTKNQLMRTTGQIAK